MSDAPRVVLDTNVLLRALANMASPSGRLIHACEKRRAIALLSKLHARFSFARDPTDAKLIELAIEGRATHLAGFDRDLLTLARSRTDAGKRFRQRLPDLHVMMPQEILLENPQLER